MNYKVKYVKFKPPEIRAAAKLMRHGKKPKKLTSEKKQELDQVVNHLVNSFGQDLLDGISAACEGHVGYNVFGYIHDQLVAQDHLKHYLAAADAVGDKSA